jgi:hypothetical protein
MGEEKLKIKGGASRRLARTKLKIRDSILPFELFVPFLPFELFVPLPPALLVLCIPAFPPLLRQENMLAAKCQHFR